MTTEAEVVVVDGDTPPASETSDLAEAVLCGYLLHLAADLGRAGNKDGEQALIRCEALIRGLDKAVTAERERIIALIEGGSFMSPDSPEAQWARSLVKAIRQQGQEPRK